VAAGSAICQQYALLPDKQPHRRWEIPSFRLHARQFGVTGFVRHGYSVPRPRFSDVKRALGQISYGSMTPLGGEP